MGAPTNFKFLECGHKGRLQPSTDIAWGPPVQTRFGKARQSVLRGLLFCSAKEPEACPNVPGALRRFWSPTGARGYYVRANTLRVLNPKPQDFGRRVGAEARRRNCEEEG